MTGRLLRMTASVVSFITGAGQTCGLAQEKAQTQPTQWAPAVKPKPLSSNVQQGLAWLIKAQHETGGWSQGEESPHMRGGGDSFKDVPNVADTCVATLALIRAGSTPRKGEHSQNVRKALDFVCNQVAESEPTGLYITKVRGTRVQQKLGPYIDTFLAAMVLAEVRDQMPDEAGRKRIIAALDKVMDKIEKNQRPDGTWTQEGWAPALSQAMASKAINRAAQAGVKLDESVRIRTQSYARGQFDGKTRQFRATGAAGVDLYASAASLGAMQDSENTNRTIEREAQQQLRMATTAPQRAEAEQTLRRIAENRSDLKAARTAVVAKLEDPGFVAGFGSNGGEEFLSHMNIGESLVVKGGSEWEKWDKSMTENLNRIQNQDGSWTGHHCITGRTFCTSAAILVLTVDRAPVPLGTEIRRR